MRAAHGQFNASQVNLGKIFFPDIRHIYFWTKYLFKYILNYYRQMLSVLPYNNLVLLLTLGAHAHSKGYSSCRVCMCVCVYVCMCVCVYV